jgi:diguanylate cyclase (GGDEF)-like protein
MDPALIEQILGRVDLGVLVVDLASNILVWNHYLEVHSGRPVTEIIGRNLFDCFPELPQKWLSRKLRTVSLLKTPAFTSWQQRPYLFRFRHHRQVTGGVDFMHQDCTFYPLLDARGEVGSICITIADATDISVVHGQLNRALAIISEQSARDGLTGLYNRRKLQEQLAVEYARVRRYGGDLSVLVLDIDHFKRVNDSFGHLVGDDVIRMVADISARTLRETDHVARYGGEEFVALLPSTNIDGAREAGERLRAEIERAEIAAGANLISVTVSVGASQLRAEHDDVEELIQDADAALYQAKRTGRNRVVASGPSMRLTGS